MTERHSPSPSWEISPQRVREMIDANADFLLLDCRTEMESRLARIDGAVLVPMQDVPSRLPSLEAHRSRPIVVYCHTGRRSLVVTRMLRDRGFEDVTSMAGGIHRWSQQIDPAVPTY